MLPSPRRAVPPSLPHRTTPPSLAPGFAASRLLPWLPFQTDPRTRLDAGTWEGWPWLLHFGCSGLSLPHRAAPHHAAPRSACTRFVKTASNGQGSKGNMTKKVKLQKWMQQLRGTMLNL
ncbi:uncharacterized protein LOC130979901 [Arachis stenosperma]|uniref:uncharacterized protein LOC130979901 n=1 Tax=Arachis stenosperma TaxID=217475 RepID=UPI0025AC97DB|nr:uncharacterized protein LOC130940864 isoform X1 [Arachis stenosperma]XP_057759429.1 uncharacterized protein LOC130979901 [Arachis stenosperma]